MADRSGDSDERSKPPSAVARAAAPASIARARRRFELAIELDADALWERIVAHPDVRVSDEPAPEPAPPDDGRFLAARTDPQTIVLRHWAGSADAVSPLVVLRVVRAGPHARVVGRFEQPRHAPTFATRGPEPTPWWQIAAPIVVLGVGFALIYAFTGPPGLWALLVALLLFAVPSGVVMLPGLVLWDAQSRREQREALWRVLGELLTPIALPPVGGDDPFR